MTRSKLPSEVPDSSGLNRLALWGDAQRSLTWRDRLDMVMKAKALNLPLGAILDEPMDVRNGMTWKEIIAIGVVLIGLVMAGLQFLPDDQSITPTPAASEPDNASEAPGPPAASNDTDTVRTIQLRTYDPQRWPGSKGTP